MPAAKMIAALDTIESALQQLAAGVTTYTAALRVVSRAVYPDHTRQFTIEQTIGRSRLAELIVRRMRALELDSVLDHGRLSGTLDDTVPATLAPTIARLEP